MPERVLVVDAANVVGSRPDGWWRDRAAAAERLLDALAPLAGSVVQGPGGAVRVVAVHVVLEGRAREAVPPAAWAAGAGALVVVLAPGEGDDAVVGVAQQVLAGGRVPLVVTADRGLRRRLPAGAQTVGPRWLTALGGGGAGR